MKKFLSKAITAIFLAVFPFGTFNCFAEDNLNVNNINSVHIEDVSANSITISNNNSTYIIDTNDLTSGSAISADSTDNGDITINNINDVHLQNVIGNDIIIVINNITYIVNVDFNKSEETTKQITEKTTEEVTENVTEETTESTDTTVCEEKSQIDTKETENNQEKKSYSSSSRKKRNRNKTVDIKNSKGEDKKYKNKVKVTIGKKEISVNDTIYGLDVMPYIQKSSDSTLIPLRAVSVALSGDTDFNSRNNNTEVVSWDKYSKKVLINYNGKIIEFTAQSNIVSVDGKTFKMENNAVSEIKNGRMFVPFRALGNALDIKVGWDKKSKTASLG